MVQFLINKNNHFMCKQLISDIRYNGHTGMYFDGPPSGSEFDDVDLDDDFDEDDDEDWFEDEEFEDEEYDDDDDY